MGIPSSATRLGETDRKMITFWRAAKETNWSRDRPENLDQNLDWTSRNTPNCSGPDDGQNVTWPDWPTWVYGPLAKHIVRKYGYVRGESLFGAPYDWRLAPLDNPYWMVRMRELVESASERNGGRRVVLIVHSLGNLYTWHFLRSMTREWREQYIDSYLALAAPWGGAVSAVLAVVTGENFDYWWVSPTIYRTALRTFPSSYALFPTAKTVANRVLVTVRGNGEDTIYTLNNIRTLFNDMGYKHAWPMYKHAQANTIDVASTPPGVTTHCVYSIGVRTAQSYIYRASQFPDKFPTALIADGDGTVNSESLALCQGWNEDDNDGKKIIVERFEGVDHREILRNAKTYSILAKILGMSLFSSNIFGHFFNLTLSRKGFLELTDAYIKPS